MKNAILLMAILICCNTALGFRPFIIRSGKSQVHLLEYYEPTNCVACDDQRKWFNNLRSDKTVFKKFIPIAIDPDKNSDRLDGLSLRSPTDSSVFALDGFEWTWAADSKIPTDATLAIGELEVARAKFQEFEVTFTPREKLGADQKITVTGALLGNGANEFSMIEMTTKDLKKVGNSFIAHLKFSMKKNPDFKTYSAVFWISKGDDLKPVQAVGANLNID